MIPNTLVEMASKPRQSHRGTPELRAYARREWHAEISWILGLFSREAARTKVRGRSRGRRPVTRPARAEAVPARSAIAPVALPVAGDCPHVLVEDLGYGGPAAFLRCALCGGVLIDHAGRRWSLSPIEPLTWEETTDG